MARGSATPVAPFLWKRYKKVSIRLSAFSKMRVSLIALPYDVYTNRWWQWGEDLWLKNEEWIWAKMHCKRWKVVLKYTLLYRSFHFCGWFPAMPLHLDLQGFNEVEKVPYKTLMIRGVKSLSGWNSTLWSLQDAGLDIFALRFKQQAANPLDRLKTATNTV